MLSSLMKRLISRGGDGGEQYTEIGIFVQSLFIEIFYISNLSTQETSLAAPK